MGTGVKLKRYEKTLVVLFEGLVGQVVEVETVLGTVLRGRVSAVESTMGMHFVEAWQWQEALAGATCTSDGSPSPGPPPSALHLGATYLSGKFIRYLMLPEEMDVPAVLEDRMRKREASLLSSKRMIWLAAIN
ncbi:uncharacterized protein AMSG_10727 [Thecamonas trahens ATCC 50062]|uniref:Uncharacterized protein n=1 Tax=Thecamonas trahens ATCC 50062 TaxID=461836 RepID=A0A0L0DS78_THETB|nr:hypothetical protein AMSG_10727 [Thecamonas trahens ATCC 50062]KNC55125.1 hypothetical protein AMSG_10727 [Thecamonas trahens ATCC 50062]|eukprot:XP_013753305.1 hypothetical protein AMSG_10727 [Thecamonas trahens ATCC 50062]